MSCGFSWDPRRADVSHAMVLWVICVQGLISSSVNATTIRALRQATSTDFSCQEVDQMLWLRELYHKDEKGANQPDHTMATDG